MSDGSKHGPAIAAAIIFLGFLALFFVMPPIMIWLAEQFSPYVAAGFGMFTIVAFFLIFWLRARYQRQRRS